MYVEVLLDQNFSRPLDYRLPDDWHVEVGMRVEVPLKSTLKKGTIAAIKEHSSYPDAKPIHRLLSQDGFLSEKQWTLARWMAQYYAAPLQRVLKCFIPVNLRKEVAEKTRVFLKLAKTHDECLKAIGMWRAKAPQRAQTLEEILNTPKGVYLTDLKTTSSVAFLIKERWITSHKIKASADLLDEADFFPSSPKTLNSEQTLCLQAISKSLSASEFAAHLIYGITGSGKTEIYMQAIQEALLQNKSAIMLVPEISLTSQTIERFKARFSEKIAILHHRRSLGERTSAWEDLRQGEARLVIGARSALFCPAKNLGLIIVDEEHDSSYKQSDEIPCYHGRDTAVMRAHIENCVVVLGSATPSLESRYNAEVGKYQFHKLCTRATSASLPKVRIVDMKQVYDRNQGFTHFSEELIDGVKKRLEKGEQTLLFLNRRGYHRLQMCKKCLYVIKCPHCDLALTFHKQLNLLQCHLCDFRRPVPQNCPQCQTSEQLHFKGFGTEHVERSLHALFPEIRTLRMDRDTTTKKNSHEEMFKQFRAHKADVLIGTQMIAKGFHFPAVTLVGILNPDATLNIPDFRASEHVFQLITQVAGRAGRAELSGEVIIQTFLPDHPVLKLAAAQDYETFYASEIAERRNFSYPPFCHMIKLLFTDPEEAKAQEKAEAAYQTLKNLPVEVLPAMPAGYAKIKDLFRFQVLIKPSKIGSVLPHLQKLHDVKIDVDPTSVF